MENVESVMEVVHYLVQSTPIGKPIIDFNQSEEYSIINSSIAISIMRNDTYERLIVCEYKGIIGFIKAVKKVLLFSKKYKLEKHKSR